MSRNEDGRSGMRQLRYCALGLCPGVVIRRSFWRGCVPSSLHITLQKILHSEVFTRDHLQVIHILWLPVWMGGSHQSWPHDIGVLCVSRRSTTVTTLLCGSSHTHGNTSCLCLPMALSYTHLPCQFASWSSRMTISMCSHLFQRIA